jgi:hypothetical protein
MAEAHRLPAACDRLVMRLRFALALRGGLTAARGLAARSPSHGIICRRSALRRTAVSRIGREDALGTLRRISLARSRQLLFETLKEWCIDGPVSDDNEGSQH